MAKAISFGKRKVLLLLVQDWLPSFQSPKRRLALGLVLATTWPLALNVSVIFAAPSLAITSAEGWAWLGAYTLLNLGMLGGARVAWRLLTVAAPELDDFIPDGATLRSLENYFSRRLRPFWQWASSLTAAVVAFLLLRVVAHQLGSELDVGIASYVTVMWTAFLGMNSLYWLFTTAEIPLRLTSSRKLNVIPIAPSTTPAVYRLCDGYAVAALGVFLGVVMTELLALLAPRSDKIFVLHALTIGFPIAAVVVATVVAVQPFVTLHFVLRREKRRILREIRSRIDRASEEEAARLEADYVTVSSSPILPYSPSTIAEYAAALAAAFLAYLTRQFLT